MAQERSFIMIKCHIPHSTLLVASEDNVARSGQQGVQVIPSVLWDPRSGHSPPLVCS